MMKVRFSALAFCLIVAVLVTGCESTEPQEPDDIDRFATLMQEGMQTMIKQHELNQDCQLGVKVNAVRQALETPDEPGAMEAVTALGRDSRYYTMVRGWLVQELKNAESQREATRDNPERIEKMDTKIAFLQEAIRRIDLE